MKFPKPIFNELKRHYSIKPESVHECSRIYRKTTPEADVYTSAMRMCEALVLANRMVRARADIAALNEFGGNGKSLLMGNFDYKANLCPHGLGRGARDVAYFLQDHWGRPTHAWKDVRALMQSEVTHSDGGQSDGAQSDTGQGGDDGGGFGSSTSGAETAMSTDENDAGQASNVQQIAARLKDTIGIVGFFGIKNFPGQGAMALWEKDTFIGVPYWNCKSVLFWKLD